MAAIGGDIIEVSVNHPELGSGSFYPKSGEGFTLDPGGFMTDDEDNGIAGDGSAIFKKTRKRWSVEGMVKWDMNGANELVFYRALEESSLESDFTFTSVNGTVWSAKGIPVGGNGGEMGDSTFTAKFSGGGRCIKIVG